MKIKPKIILGYFILMMCFYFPILTCAEQLQFEEVYIGIVEPSQLTYGNYTLYEVEEQTFISINTLKVAGFSVDESQPIWHIELGTQQENDTIELEQISGEAFMSKYPIYCGNIRSFALKVDDNYLIPIEALQAVGKLHYEDKVYWIESDFQNPLPLVQVDEKSITNITDHIIWLTYKSFYWHEEDFKVIEEEAWLEPGEKIEHAHQDGKDYLYITTVIEKIDNWPVQMNNALYGQCDGNIFQQYSDSIYLRYLTPFFPPYILMGEMKQPVGTLQAKEVVEIYRSEKHEVYYVKDKNGKLNKVPHWTVRVTGDKGPFYGSSITPKMIEDFATLNHVESQTDYLIWTDLYRQRTYILKNQDGKWHLEKNFVCSSGRKDNPTPPGFYEVEYKIPQFGREKGFTCKNAVVFFRDYMYHSVLFDKTGTYVKSGQNELGNQASHGCVRLSEKDSKWMHSNIPMKTKVWIR